MSACIVFPPPYDAGLFLKPIPENEFPKKLQICVGAFYSRPLKFERNSSNPHPFSSRLIILSSTGFIELQGADSSQKVKIHAHIDDRVLHYHNKDKELIMVCSEPLTIKEVNEIADKIRSRRIHVLWHIDGYGLEDAYIPVEFSIGSPHPLVISWQQFLEDVVGKANLVKFMFLEIPIESIDESSIDRIPDPDLREVLKILMRKQKLLIEALENLRKATRVSEYKNVIDDVRRAIERVVEDPSEPGGSKIAQVVMNALKYLGIAEGVTPDALDEAVKEIVDVLIGKASLSRVLYALASKFVHTYTLSRKQYIPKPHRNEAELCLVLAIAFLNYLIKTLMEYSYKL